MQRQINFGHRLYSGFWSQITGELVAESGLYFTSIPRWVKL
jgi:hypothetical protein